MVSWCNAVDIVVVLCAQGRTNVSRSFVARARYGCYTALKYWRLLRAALRRLREQHAAANFAYSRGRILVCNTLYALPGGEH